MEKNDRNKGIYIKAWDSVCTSKAYGGLDLENPHKFNLALLTRLAWRLLENPNKLWSIILKCKYFPKKDPLNYKNKSVRSWVWTSICRGIEVLKENHSWEIGNGENINLWHDRWLPNGNFPKPRGDVSNTQFKKVVHIIDNNGNWNNNLIEHLFDSNTIKEIKSL